MELVFEPNSRLPRLAWRAVVVSQRQTCRVAHGPWVETLEGAFVDGVWDAEFTRTSIAGSAYLFGSAGLAGERSMTFIASSGTTDCLYWHADAAAARVEVSNSLPLLLASLDDELDPRCDRFHVINESIALGIHRYERRLPTRRGAVNRLLHRNLVIGPDGVREVDKQADPPFAGYDDYYRFVTACYARLAANARDSRRARPMAIFSTQSKGYDSTAVNAIAARHGVDKVFTVTKGKAKGYYGDDDQGREPDDDGTAICEFFGLTCVPIDRRAIERNTDDEHLIYATMHESGDLNLQELAAHVGQPTVLLTGALGELWYTAGYYRDRPGYINPNYVRADLGNHGMTETRLRSGYVQLPVPYIGAGSREDIYRITASAEMAAWRLDVAYDRPIPRRMAEDAGLPRTMFGQSKMASLFELPAPVVPVGAGLRREYLDFLVRERIRSRWQLALLPQVRRWNAIVNTTSPNRHRWNYYLQRLLSRLTGRAFQFDPLADDLNGRIFCFGVNRRVPTYKAALMPQQAAPCGASI